MKTSAKHVPSFALGGSTLSDSKQSSRLLARIVNDFVVGLQIMKMLMTKSGERVYFCIFLQWRSCITQRF